MLFGDVVGAARRMVLIEACARVLKNKLNLSLQQKMKEVSSDFQRYFLSFFTFFFLNWPFFLLLTFHDSQLRLPLEIPYRQEVVRLINIWFSEVADAAAIWDSDTPNGIRDSLKRSFEFSCFTRSDLSLIPEDWQRTPVSSFLSSSSRVALGSSDPNDINFSQKDPRIRMQNPQHSAFSRVLF
jgi:hypothetical protein